MNSAIEGLQRSALVMKILGWGLIAGLISGLFLYPPGFLWGSHPATFPNIGPRILNPRSTRYIPTFS